MRKTVPGSAVIPFLVLGVSAGCFQPKPMLPQQLEHGYIVMLPGVESSAWPFEGTLRGLREAGVDQAIDVIEWGDRPFGSLKNLTHLDANRQRAGAISQRIGAYIADHPDRPVTLIGYSGGGGVAVLTAEALADGVMLDRIILMAAAISPDYDLTQALQHSRRGLINFYSTHDWWPLGVVTSLLGTIDRKRTDSAGYVGFADERGRLLQSDRLTQCCWRPPWSKLGHNGSHTGWLSRAWAREILAPEIDPSVSRRAAQ